MSSNRLHYDKCAKEMENASNKNILEHTMDVNMFENKKPESDKASQPGSYLVATTSRNFSNKSSSKLIDVESKLRRLNKKNTKCGE